MYFFSLLLFNDDMRTIDEIRRINLAALAAEVGGPSALALLAGKSDSQISQWINGSANSGTGKPRGMRSSSCRELELVCKKPVGWMEVDHEVGKKDFDTNVQPSSMGTRAIPVISAIQAGAMKEITVPYAAGDGFATIFVDDSYSRWAFGLEIDGDSMMPDYQPGDVVIIEPEWQPRPGDCVAAKNGRQEATF